MRMFGLSGSILGDIQQGQFQENGLRLPQVIGTLCRLQK
jgi:hypothetical protein